MDRKSRIVSIRQAIEQPGCDPKLCGTELRMAACSLRSSRKFRYERLHQAAARGHAGWAVANAVVAEFCVLDHRVAAASHCDASMKEIKASCPWSIFMCSGLVAVPIEVFSAAWPFRLCEHRSRLRSGHFDVRARMQSIRRSIICPSGALGPALLAMRPYTSVPRLVRRIRRQRHLLLPGTADENELGFSWRRGAGELRSRSVDQVGRKSETALRIASLHFEPSTLPGPATDQLKLPSRAPDTRHRQWG